MTILIENEGGGTTNLPSNLALDSLTLNGGTAPQGMLVWNADEQTVSLVQDGVTAFLTQELQWQVRNNTLSVIRAGTVVMATGTIGASSRITVAPYDASVATNAHLLLGIAHEDLPVGGDGKVLHFGKVRGIDTSGFAEGAVLYADPAVPGGLTATKPTGLAQAIAFVVSSHATNGALAVRVETRDHNAGGSTGPDPWPSFQVTGNVFSSTIFLGDTVDHNVGSAFNTTNGRFTAPVAGLYQFNFTLTPADAQNHFIDIYKNGAIVGPNTLHYDALYKTGSNIKVLKLAANDYVEARRKLTYAVYGASFGGALIRAD